MTAVGELITPTGRLVLPPDADRAQWLEYRKWREDVPGHWCIGASEVPSILDLDGVDTPAHVYRSKVLGVRKSATEAMEIGQEMEPVIVARWTRINRAVTDEIGLVSNVDRPWLQCTIDRRVRECPLTGMRDNCLLEAKNVGYSSAQRWGRDVPDRIYSQILVQLAVTGYSHGHYACMIGGNTLRQGTFYADRERAVMDYIVAEVERFRDDYLIPGVEPAWDTSRKAAKLIELDTATHPIRAGEIGIDEVGDVLEYAEAAAAEGVARKRKEQHLAALRQHADGAEVVLFGDSMAYRFGETRKRNCHFDALAEKYPDAYADPEVVYESVSHPIYLAREHRQ